MKALSDSDAKHARMGHYLLGAQVLQIKFDGLSGRYAEDGKDVALTLSAHSSAVLPSMVIAAQRFLLSLSSVHSVCTAPAYTARDKHALRGIPLGLPLFGI
jgi:hypothetical protein